MGPPNVVDVFIRSDRAGEFADDAIDVGAVAVWIPVNVIDADAAQRVMGRRTAHGDGSLPSDRLCASGHLALASDLLALFACGRIQLPLKFLHAVHQ